MPLRWSLVSGRANLSDALARRFISLLGSVPDDPEYGLDLRDYLNAGLTPAGLSQLRNAIVTQAGADPRIQSVDSVDFTFNEGANALTVTLGLSDGQGPFDLILGINSVTVEILDRGQLAAAPVVASSAPAVASGGVGPAGPAGAPGTSGPAGPAGVGGGGTELTFPETYASSSGSEEIVAQLTVDFGGISGGTLTFDLSGQALSATGTATVKLYVGGTYGAADGTLLGSASVPGSSFAQIQISTTSSNPTGLKPVKVSITSSGAAHDAQLRDFTVSIR